MNLLKEIAINSLGGISPGDLPWAMSCAAWAALLNGAFALLYLKRRSSVAKADVYLLLRWSMFMALTVFILKHYLVLSVLLTIMGIGLLLAGMKVTRLSVIPAELLVFSAVVVLLSGAGFLFWTGIAAALFLVMFLIQPTPSS
jgi:hypothetical protein